MTAHRPPPTFRVIAGGKCGQPSSATSGRSGLFVPPAARGLPEIAGELARGLDQLGGLLTGLETRARTLLASVRQARTDLREQRGRRQLGGEQRPAQRRRT